MMNQKSETEPDETLDQTGYLLQRLRELQAWQQEQEMKMLQEQDRQIEMLRMANQYQPHPYDQQASNSSDDEENDDTTIGNDWSSLTSLDDAAKSSSSIKLSSSRLQEPKQVVTFDEDTSLVPSWASRKVEPTIGNLDDMPIVASAKTFDELLAEKLSCTPATNNDIDGKAIPSSETRTFLRKGSGLARYKTISNAPKSSRGVHRRNSSRPLQSQTRDAAGKKMSSSCSKIEEISRELPAKASVVRQLALSAGKTRSPIMPRAQTSSAPIKLATKNQTVNSCDPIPWIDKLSQNGESAHLKGLEAFEMLEEAVCSSSFCSQSSAVQHLLHNVDSASSPIPKMGGSISLESMSSTPIAAHRPGRYEDESISDYDEEHSGGSSSPRRLNEQLLSDIKLLLQKRGATVENGENVARKDQVDEEGSASPVMAVLNDCSEDEDRDMKDLLGVERGSSVKRRSGNHVHFDLDPDVKSQRDERLAFSPPRIPKNSASYQIWSIFAKDRQVEAKSAKKAAAAPPSPLSKAKLLPYGSDPDFQTSLVNAKLAELQQQVSHFKEENAKLAELRRKLNTERKNLAGNVKQFEALKESEKKKLEDERKWVRREKALLERAQREKRSQSDKKLQDELDELQAKNTKLLDDMKRKETKWANAVTKLQEQVRLLEKENQHLHQENHKLKLKSVSPKVSTHLFDRRLAKNGTPDSGIKDSAPDDDNSSSNGNIDSVKHTCIDEGDKEDAAVAAPGARVRIPATPRLDFSPVDSLESNVTLVSASTATIVPKTSTVTEQEQGLKKKLKSVVRDEAKGTVEKTYLDGSIEICFANGNRKEIDAARQCTKVVYYNGDIKETLSNKMVRYFYSQTKTWHITYPDGKEVLQFSNGQEETRYPNGSLQISFADGSVKMIASDGSESISLPDGTKMLVDTNGDRTLILPNGQREIHTALNKRREYPDGTVKIMYEDGRQETRYASGRVRIKNREGKLIQDSAAGCIEAH